MGTTGRDVLGEKTASVDHGLPGPRLPQISEPGGRLAWVLLGVTWGPHYLPHDWNFLGAGWREGQKIRHT